MPTQSAIGAIIAPVITGGSESTSGYALSIRELILDTITELVGGEYDIPAPESERDLPITIVADGFDVARDDVYDQTHIEMPVAIASAAAATSTDKEVMRAQANAILAGLIKAVLADDTFGGLADGASYTGGGIQTEVGKFVFAEAQFIIRYHHQRGEPSQRE